VGPNATKEHQFFANPDSAAIFVPKNFPLSNEQPVEIFGQKFTASNNGFDQNLYSLVSLFYKTSRFVTIVIK
jgi:hypothetical protein